MSKIYLHPGENNHTTWNTNRKQHETHKYIVRTQWLIFTSSKKEKEKRSLQLPETGFLLLLKSWALLWSPEIKNKTKHYINFSIFIWNFKLYWDSCVCEVQLWIFPSGITCVYVWDQGKENQVKGLLHSSLWIQHIRKSTGETKCFCTPQNSSCC